MMILSWRDLALLTVRDPDQAAQILMAMRLPRDVLWTGLFLVAVLNTLVVVSFSLVMSTTSEGPGLAVTPFVSFAVAVASIVAMVYVLHYVGRGLGGDGQLPDMMVLMVWLQGLQVLAQALIAVVSLAVPAVTGFLVLIFVIAGLHISVQFVKKVHGFENAWKAAGVLLASVLALTLVLTVLISLFGGPNVGATGNV